MVHRPYTDQRNSLKTQQLGQLQRQLSRWLEEFLTNMQTILPKEKDPTFPTYHLKKEKRQILDFLA